MSQDRPVGPVTAVGYDPADAPTVVEWGDNDRSRWRFQRVAADLRADPRIAATTAGLAAVALFGSLLSDWRIWRVVVRDQDAIIEYKITNGVVSFPSVGTGYLIGLFALATCFVLTKSGTAAARRNARLVGLATTAVQLAVLVTAVTNLDQVGGTIEDLTMSENGFNGGQLSNEIQYGNGLHLAFAGVLLMALALVLAAPPERNALAPEPNALTPEQRDDEATPVDLTVQPATPFLRPDDRPSGR